MSVQPLRRGPGRPPKENLLEGLTNLDTGEAAPDFSAQAKPDKKNLLISTQELTFWTGYGGAQISDLKSQGVIDSKRIGFWEALPTFSALIKRLRMRQQQFSTEDKARKLKAEADSAELKALEAGKETCLMSQAKQYWSDNRIAVRQTIERAEYIPKGDREKLLREIAAMGPIALQRIATEETEREKATDAQGEPELPLEDY